jgi:GH15 family glucan-1,4-alpha-glucosidase
MSSRPIADYALISDCHSAALVASDGSIEWLCFSRFDGPSVFARTLDDDAGHWSIGIEGATTTRRYIDDSMVVETTFQTSSGEATLVDALAVGQNERGHSLGLNSPHALLRRITCTSGEVEFKFEYAPRPEYGLIMPILTKVDGGIAARGGADVLLLSSPIDMGRSESTARAGIRLSQGQSVCFGLQHWRSWEEPIGPWREDQVAARIDDTVSAWNSWSGHHQAYDGPWRDLVHQSGRVLQSLTFAPTGAIVASPTTSLPEEAGGERNWDYRYAWVRDASLTVEALWVAACPDEADRFFDWMAGAAATQLHRGADLQIMFGVGGERDLTERSLDHLRGWRDSKPVRVGNGAWDQRQLDVYGELLNGAYRLSDQLKDFDPTTRSFLAAAADTAAARWEEPDQGIWEIRGGPQHFLYSKLMCWVALDRAIYLAYRIYGYGRVEHWS